MKYIDLTVSTNYVPDWGVWEGIRELVQNALDRERETPEGKDPATRVMSDNRMSIQYDEENETLTIESANTRLERRTLIIGEGSKRQNGETIGQHGEGYKLAMIALLRAGKSVVIWNGGAKWEPSFVRNEALDAEVLRISFGDETIESSSLIFTVGGIDAGEWEEVQDNVRLLHDSGEMIRGNGAWLLPDEREMGRLYVGGIFVREMNTDFLYGYDFDPDVIHLDRDRRTVDSSNLAWKCSSLLGNLGADYDDLIVRAVRENKDDVDKTIAMADSTLERIGDRFFDEFQADHGERAIPVSYNWEATEVRTKFKGVKPVVIGGQVHDIIRHSKRFGEWLAGVEPTEKATPAKVLRDFLDRHAKYFPQTLADAFSDELIDRAETEEWSL